MKEELLETSILTGGWSVTEICIALANRYRLCLGQGHVLRTHYVHSYLYRSAKIVCVH